MLQGKFPFKDNKVLSYANHHQRHHHWHLQFIYMLHWWHMSQGKFPFKDNKVLSYFNHHQRHHHWQHHPDWAIPEHWCVSASCDGVDHSDLRRNAGSEAGPEGPAVCEAADLRRHHGLCSDQETAGGHDGAVQQDVAQHPVLLHAPWVGWYPR